MHERRYTPLRAYRLLAGLYQADVASVLGCSAMRISLLERGLATPTQHELQTLDRLFLFPVSATWHGPVRNNAEGGK